MLRTLALVAAVAASSTAAAQPDDPEFKSAYAGHTCKVMDPVLFTLPDDMAEAQADFMAKARRLRDQGHCVIEGNWGKAYRKFYFAIDKNDKPRDYFTMRFTRQELKQ